jgi:hypothetical protein
MGANRPSYSLCVYEPSTNLEIKRPPLRRGAPERKTSGLFFLLTIALAVGGAGFAGVTVLRPDGHAAHGQGNALMVAAHPIAPPDVKPVTPPSIAGEGKDPTDRSAPATSEPASHAKKKTASSNSHSASPSGKTNTASGSNGLPSGRMPTNKPPSAPLPGNPYP